MTRGAVAVVHGYSKWVGRMVPVYLLVLVIRKGGWVGKRGKAAVVRKQPG